MPEEKVKIRYVFEDRENSSINSALSHLDKAKKNLHIVRSEKLELNENEIIVLQISSLESPILAGLLKNKNSIKNKIIFIFGENDAFLISRIVKLGYNNFFVFPREFYKFLEFVSNIIENESYKPEEESGKQYYFKNIVGVSQSIKEIIELGKKVADRQHINILILGETGTGKGLLAQAIHNYSIYKEFPFIDVPCTSIPENLMESELFGYEKGAFTNAHNTKLGLFEIAKNGTLFLDEIGDLNINIQSKLLRTIDKKVIRRLGGVNDIPIEARIISATNRNLELLVKENLFRKDLYHRLNVVSIELPPLRERKEDIILLANYFIEKYNKIFSKSILEMNQDFEDFILNYPWTGNIRELQNFIERNVLLAESEVLTIENFTKKKNEMAKDILPVQKDVDLLMLNRLYASEILKRANGNKSRASKILGISRPKLDSLLKKGV